MTGDDTITSAANIFVTTNLAAATATVAVMFITWIRYKKPDVSMTLNGSLAGLVAITAGCDMVDPFGAFFIGLIAAFVVVFGIEFVDKKLHIDDPVGAIGVHGCCGAAGTPVSYTHLDVYKRQVDGNWWNRNHHRWRCGNGNGKTD